MTLESFTPAKSLNLLPFFRFVIQCQKPNQRMVPPRVSKAFEDYAALDVIPTIQSSFSKYDKTNIVFDFSQPSSLKTEQGQSEDGESDEK